MLWRKKDEIEKGSTCVYVCVCVCVLERERGREKERETQTDRDRNRDVKEAVRAFMSLCLSSRKHLLIHQLHCIIINFTIAVCSFRLWKFVFKHMKEATCHSLPLPSRVPWPLKLSTPTLNPLLQTVTPYTSLVLTLSFYHRSSSPPLYLSVWQAMH